MKDRKPPLCDFSGLPSDQCAHCSGPPRRLSPHYELKLGWFGRWPVVEILKDGGPVHRYDKHFRFGTEKARLLLDAISVIREFEANTDEEGNTTVTSQMLDAEDNNVTFQTWIEMHQEFVRSDGETIIRPWLHLKRLPVGKQIGIGVQKAKAVCALEKDLRNWVEIAQLITN